MLFGEVGYRSLTRTRCNKTHLVPGVLPSLLNQRYIEVTNMLEKPGRRSMKRALNCFCGQYLEGDNDEELLNWTRAHASRKHSDVGLTDEQVRKIVEAGAYDTRGKAQER